MPHHLRKSKRKTRKQHAGALCNSGANDTYNPSPASAAPPYESEDLLISYYTNTSNPSQIIKKLTCTTAKPKLIGQVYADMYKIIKQHIHESTHNVGPRLLYYKICCDAQMRPLAYIVTEAQALPQNRHQGGALCADPDDTWVPGTQIGQADQIGESEDPLYIAESNPDAIVKRLTGGGSPHSASTKPSDIAKTFTDIYTEIKLTLKAADLNVGPRILFSKICSDADLRPNGYIVMERINGSYIKKEQIQPNRDTIRGLIDTLYSNRIDHDDLHNRNIMIGSTPSHPTPKIWLIDYGAALLTPTVVPVADRNYSIHCISETNPHNIRTIERVN
jgi:hypothetical protein